MARLGLYRNMKAGGDAALERTEQLLAAGFPGEAFTRCTGSVGWLMRHAVNAAMAGGLPAHLTVALDQ